MTERPVHEDPYPSRIAMEAAVELEVCAALGYVQTQTIGKVIQRAINKAINQHEDGRAKSAAIF